MSTEPRPEVEMGGILRITINGIPYVAIRKDLFDKQNNLVCLDEDMTHEEMLASLAASAEANGWNDSSMSDYDRYDEMRNEEG